MRWPNWSCSCRSVPSLSHVFRCPLQSSLFATGFSPIAACFRRWLLLSIKQNLNVHANAPRIKFEIKCGSIDSQIRVANWMAVKLHFSSNSHCTSISCCIFSLHSFFFSFIYPIGSVALFVLWSNDCCVHIIIIHQQTFGFFSISSLFLHRFFSLSLDFLNIDCNNLFNSASCNEKRPQTQDEIHFNHCFFVAFNSSSLNV